MSATASQPRDLVSTMVAFVPRMMRAKRAGLLAVGLGILGTLGAALSSRRLYRSEAVLMYEPAAANVSSGGGESPRQVAARLQDMVSSRQRLESVITGLNLYAKTVDRRGMVEAVEEMRSRLKLVGNEGYTYRLSFDIDSRELAPQVLTYLLKTVIDDDSKRRQKDAGDSKNFLDAERKRADADLKSKEQALAAFLAKHPQLAAETSATGGAIRAADRGSGASSGEIVSLEMQAAQIEDALAAAMRQVAPGVTGVPSLDPAIAALQARAEAELSAAQRDLAEKQNRFTDEHPDVKAAAWRLTQAEAAAKQARSAASAGLAAATAAARAEHTAAPVEDPANSPRVAALRRAMGAVRSQIAALRSRETPKGEGARNVDSIVSVDTDWTQLARGVAEARERQQQLEGKQFQAQLLATLVAGNQAGGLVIADPPFKPMRPISGGRAKVLIAGFAGSVMLALLVLIVAGLLDRHIYDAHDVANAVHADIVVVVPRLTGKGA